MRPLQLAKSRKESIEVSFDQKEKKGFKKRIKSFLRRFDPRPDFTFKEGE